jgi:hypothetical protein
MSHHGSVSDATRPLRMCVFGAATAVFDNDCAGRSLCSGLCVSTSNTWRDHLENLEDTSLRQWRSETVAVQICEAALNYVKAPLRWRRGHQSLQLPAHTGGIVKLRNLNMLTLISILPSEST